MAHEHHDRIAAILKRQDEAGGPHLSEAEIARELHLDLTQVSAALHEMTREGHVSRTGEGNWELTPAAAMRTSAQPDPKEPRQG
jgi:DNA-binding IclR family transcriptional regulator